MRFPGRSLSGSDMHRRRAVTVRTVGGFWRITPVVKETGVLYHPRVRNNGCAHLTATKTIEHTPALSDAARDDCRDVASPHLPV